MLIATAAVAVAVAVTTAAASLYDKKQGITRESTSPPNKAG
jgi:hypothetical protein